MPTDTTTALLAKLEALDPEDQQELVEVGEQFGTVDVLLQVARFADAWTTTGVIPARYGFASDGVAELALLALAISEVSGIRVSKEIVRSTSTDDFRDTISRSKRAVSGARTVLMNAESSLRLVPGTESKEARRLIRATLDKLGKAGRSKVRLQVQIDALRATLSDTNVASALRIRGGPEAVEAIDAAAADLGSKAAPGTKVRGNPVETRKLNLLEGHAVILLRQARSAARDWSRDRRDPALGSAYGLEFLYAPSASTSAPAEPTNPPPPVVT